MIKKVKFELTLPKKGEVFTHKDGDTGEIITFLVEVMKPVAAEWGGKCEEIRYQRLPIIKEVVERIRSNFGIEQLRLDRLKAPYLFTPIIAVEWGSKDQILPIDGNHRVVKLFELGHKSVDCYIFSSPFWNHFTGNVKDPEKFLKGNSGILEHENTMMENKK